MKKFIVRALAALIFIAGLVSMMLPFVPLGWLLIALSSLLMVPYFMFMRKFIGWLAKKDTTGFVEKAGKKAAKLYRWAGDPKSAEKLEAVIKESNESTKNKPD